MATKKYIPKWVGKVLLISYAMGKYPYIKGQVERLIQDEEESIKKAEIEKMEHKHGN